MEAIRKLLQEQFKNLLATGHLFRSNIEGDLLWAGYLEGFNQDPIWRAEDSSIHNCNYCKGFIRHYGPIVAINQNYELISLFDIDDDKIPDEYKKSIKDMRDLIHAQGKVNDIFIESFAHLADPRTPYEENPKDNQPTYRIGVEHNIKRYLAEDIARWPNSGFKLNQVETYRHFYLDLPREYVNFSTSSIQEIMSIKRSTKDAFKRILDEVSPDTMQLVIELEEQGSLLNAAQYMPSLKKCLEVAEQYQSLTAKQRDNFAWIQSLENRGAIIKNSSALGKLLEDLADGETSLEKACESYNYMVDPANYRRASAPVSKSAILKAQEFIEKNGFEESFIRRCATIEDIQADLVLFSNQTETQTKTKVSIFDGLKPTTIAKTNNMAKGFDKLEKVPVDAFMADFLPRCESVEVYLDNIHKNNFMTLLTSNNKDSKRIFKWMNNFSWSYVGGNAGKSMIKTAVKQAGGNVEAPFRFSIMWNEDWQTNPVTVDFDAHAIEPNGVEIFYSTPYRKDRGNQMTPCSGQLDIDMINPPKTGVENIYWTNTARLKDGKYILFINNFGGANRGCKAEIFIDGVTYQYHVTKAFRNKENQTIAEVWIKDGHLQKIDHSQWLVKEETKQETVYDLDTCQFHPVSLVCVSPNYWQGEGVGNKHYFFMLKGAKAPEKIRSIYNEFLIPELYNYRKVLEVLGNQLKVDSTPNQLSGLGFNATVRDEVVLRLTGDFENNKQKLIKVTF